MEFLNQAVTFKCSDGVDMATYVAVPKSDDRHPAIIIVHELGGLTSRLKVVADLTKKITLVEAGGTAMTLLDLKPSTIDIDFTIPSCNMIEFEKL